MINWTVAALAWLVAFAWVYRQAVREERDGHALRPYPVACEPEPEQQQACEVIVFVGVYPQRRHMWIDGTWFSRN
jgi:hypothetical protein